jgi:hypothetical protein
MGVKLLPLSVAELCAHALALERDAEVRFRDYATRMREIGQPGFAAEFDKLAAEQDDDVRALEAAAGAREPAELSPWEFVWRLTFMPEGTDARPRLVPMSPREALQLAVVAKRRAEVFYNDVATNAGDRIVRDCAAEMAASESRQIRRLERLLGAELREDKNQDQSGIGDASLPR